MNGTEAVSEDKVAGVQIGGIDVLQQQAVAVGELDEHIVAHLLKGHVVNGGKAPRGHVQPVLAIGKVGDGVGAHTVVKDKNVGPCAAGHLVVAPAAVNGVISVAGVDQVFAGTA